MGDSETDCRAIVEKLYLYLDGQIAASDCTEFEVHLERCTGCADHVEFERTVLEVVRRKCRCDDIPAGLLDRVRARLQQDT